MSAAEELRAQHPDAVALTDNLEKLSSLATLKVSQRR
jgi:hypothetical protein